jgi:hypothetical protein
MTMTAATFGIAAGADQRAEVQVEVRAELQPPIGVRDRHRALDVVRDSLGGRVREVVHRQDDDVVAHAHPPVLAPPALERGLVVDDGHGCSLGMLLGMLYWGTCGNRLTSAWS